jgi:cystathionine beta-lyase/cystathionine gamma-synthase
LRFETRALHAGTRPDKAYGAVSVPIYQSSTFVYEDIGKNEGFSYSRAANPTRQVLEDTLASLEGGNAGFAFGSGMAAETTVVHLLRSGEHLLCVADMYGGTYRLLKDIMPSFGIASTFIQMESPEAIEAAIEPNTRMIWIESPTNPLLNIVDIAMIARVARKHELISVIDNTFASPYFQQPLGLGMDISLHSLTKYLGGHSDVVGGAVVTGRDDLASRLKKLQISTGPILGPFDSWLVLRGIETLALRMKQHEANATVIAEYLNHHPAVSKVMYPGLEGHPGHSLAKKQMSGFGGMVSFEFKDGKKRALNFLRSAKLFALADSLGGTHSLAEIAALQSHASMDDEYRKKIGISDGLIRLSVGLEHIDDLLEDLEPGLRG